jgi:uncharacterized protein
MYVTRRLLRYDLGQGRELVCNGFTGELSVLTGAGARLLADLAGQAAAPIGSPVLDTLRARRFVFASRAEEEASFAAVCQAAWSEFTAGSPRHYTFIVNTHCNFACPYCFETEVSRAVAQRMDTARIDAAFRVIDRLARDEGTRGGPEVEIFGGEPLLPGSRPAIEHLLARVRERGGTASLQTNGYHLTRYLDLLARYPATLDSLQVTLDGPREVHDRRRVPRNGRPTFDRIVAAIDALAAADLPVRVSVRTNVDRDNLDCLPALARLYEEKGWTRDPRFVFVAAPVDDRSCTLGPGTTLVGWRELLERVLPLSTDTGGGPFDLAVFKAIGWLRHCLGAVRSGRAVTETFQPRVTYCEAAALKLFVFHPDGRLYPCPETVGSPDLAIGRYDPTFLLDPERAAPWLEHTILTRRACRDCAISTLCGGGCVLAALRRHGRGGEPVCEEAPEVIATYLGQLRGAPT